MALIRVALVGLSSGAMSWAVAHLQYFLSPLGREKYQIVALCNSSVQAAQKAVEKYSLPPETRTYGNPEDLAADEDVDLVVCATRVDLHYEAIRPSIEAGKSVYCEWPLAQDIDHVRELVHLVRQEKIQAIIGTQGRFAPVCLKLRELLEVGKIGRVVSSHVLVSEGKQNFNVVPESRAYFLDSSIGGNIFTIRFGHLFDFVQSVLGEAQDIQSRLQLQRPEVDITVDDVAVRTARSDVPDFFVLTATLTPSNFTQKGAILLLSCRTGQPFPGQPTVDWTIEGEGGRIRLQAYGSSALNAAAPYFSKPVTIELHDFKNDKVEKVPWEWEEWQDELPIPTRNIASVYESFASGSAYIPTFEHALVRHEQLQQMLNGWKQSG
ncbi:NAD(P)-binding protein [Thozetella sp. PMI_491]|nr:NAD(P)-binding protein [Thozetella sp. PMI_491]